MPPPQNRSQVPAGTVLEGKFRIAREIGRGGMAAVYEAENIDIGKRVAVKILAAELLTSRIVRERFLREARAAAAIRSPYICDVYDSGMFDERPFLVMELLEGESLYDLLSRLRRLDAAATLRIAAQTARGLAKAHEANVIHRDLKPENIFITKNEEGDTIAKILDFGLAKFYEPTGGDKAQTRLTREGALFGTPAYMSPEQAKGQGEVDHRADLWALACIVYECLTGQTVWNVEQGVAMILAQIAGAPIPRPSKLRPDLPSTFEPWFLKALDRDAGNRFQTAKEFAASLEQALRPEGPPEWRTPSLVSEDNIVIDEPLAISSPGPLSSSPLTPQVESARPPTVSQLTPPKTFDVPDDPAEIARASRPGSGRAIAALVAVAAAALGGYALWLYVLHPPSADGVEPDPAGSVEPPVASAAPEQVPVEKEPYALQIASAQSLLHAGKPDTAIALFKEAFDNGGTGTARALLSQAGVVLERSEGKCRVTGLGRPRPFELTGESSRPALGVGSAGIVAAWADNHEDQRKRQVFTSLLDSALRRVSPVRLVTPEAESVRHPELYPVGDKLVLIYSDGGKQPGIHVRLLEQDGRIATAAQRISESRKADSHPPALAAAPDGSFWIVWEEESENGSDLMARQVGADLQPAGNAVRLTAFAAGRRAGAALAGRPSVAVAGDHLNVLFGLERDRTARVMLLSARLDDPMLKSGIGAPEETRNKRTRNPKKGEDRAVGRLEAVSAAHGKNTQPRLACNAAGCFAVWDNEKAGALAAFVDPAQGKSLWHREFARSGARPGVAAGEHGAAIAWYEGGRVRLAAVHRDGVEAASPVARVSGLQPYPAIAPGSQAGQWYISWRDYEAGHLEAFVVRAECQ
jgi:eukaryotic-like serine/threonine-protein kinase